MSQRIHDRFVIIAEEIALPLVQAIDHVGPIAWRRSTAPNLPELLCRAVAGQQLSTAAARTIWGRVIECAGERPLLPYLARCRPDTLRACGLSAAKGKALQGIARAANAGAIDEAALAQMTHAERSAELTALWGVGQWTADMASISYFRDPDVWPALDISARRTLESLSGNGTTAAETAARFAPHRTYLAMYMWRYRDNPPVLG